MDYRSLVDVVSLVVAVVGAYLASVRRLETRIAAMEVKIAILLDRDRRRRLADYQTEETEHG